MVVITIVTQKNGETIYFDEPFFQVHFMKLISCSLYNSWHTLKREGSAVLGDEKKDPSVSVSKIPPGHYNLEDMAKIIEGLFEKYQYHQLKTKITPPGAILEIKNLGTKKITLDRDLANLLDLTTYVKNLRYPTTYFIHCNLIDKNKNFLNFKKKDLLAKVDIKGKPYEKISYGDTKHECFRECSTSSHVNNITLSVRDQDGELFDFKGFNLEFVFEIK